jgi:hypothetical protein
MNCYPIGEGARPLSLENVGLSPPYNFTTKGADMAKLVITESDEETIPLPAVVIGAQMDMAIFPATPSPLDGYRFRFKLRALSADRSTMEERWSEWFFASPPDLQTLMEHWQGFLTHDGLPGLAVPPGSKVQ